MFLLGVALFNVAALASACATQLEWLAFFRAVQGVGAAGVMSVNLALIQRIFPPDKLGRGAGLNALIVGMGYSLGPTVASLLLAVLPWPWLLGLQAPLGLVGWLMARRYLPRTEPAGADVPYDRVLALLSALCFASLSDRYPPAILGGAGLGILSAGMASLGAVGLHSPFALTAGLGAVLSLARLRAR